MLRVEITATDGTRHVLDLYENAPINLNLQFADLTNFGVVSSSYTQTFRIPATEGNKALFGEADNPNVYADDQGYYSGKWSTKRRLSATISYDTLPLIHGYIQFKRSFITRQAYAEFEIVFFGETSEISKSIGDGTLDEMDWSAYDHTPNIATIQSSWQGNLFAGDIRYGLIDRGENWYASGGVTPLETTGIDCTQLTPMMRITAVLDAILTEAGYTYDSSWTAGVDDVYLPLMSANDRLYGDMAATYGLQVNFTGLKSGIQRINLSEISGWDYGNTWTQATGIWTAPFTCTAVFTLSFDFSVQGVGDSGGRIGVKRTGTQDYYYVTPWIAVGDSYSNSVEVVVPIASGQSIEVMCICPGAEELNINLVTLQLQSLYYESAGYAYWLGANFPDIKKIDFIKSLQKSFNLVIVPDKSKPNHLYIEDWNSYIGTGLTKDWSNKVDYEKDVVIEPTLSMQKRTYEWTDDKGTDLINAQVVTSLERVWGRHRILDTDNDFATGDYKVQTAFVPYTTSYIPNSTYIIHRALGVDGTKLKDPKPRMAYWNGLESGTLKVRSSNAVTTLATYPLFTSYSAYPCDVTDSMLTFGADAPFHAGIAQPLNTLFYTYWRNLFTELFSVDSRMMTAYINLTASDVNQFRFSDKIWIRDAYWRVHSISNYSANEQGSTQVVLIKLLEPKRDCDYTPTAVSATNQVVTFIDADGNTSGGNQVCCEKYGYVWQLTKCLNPNPQSWPKPGGATDPIAFDSFVDETTGDLTDLTEAVDGITTKTDLITITTPVDLDNVQAPDTSELELFAIFLEK